MTPLHVGEGLLMQTARRVRRERGNRAASILIFGTLCRKLEIRRRPGNLYKRDELPKWHPILVAVGRRSPPSASRSAPRLAGLLPEESRLRPQNIKPVRGPVAMPAIIPIQPVLREFALGTSVIALKEEAFSPCLRLFCDFVSCSAPTVTYLFLTKPSAPVNGSLLLTKGWYDGKRSR